MPTQQDTNDSQHTADGHAATGRAGQSLALIDSPAREQLRLAVARLDRAERDAQPYEMACALTAVARSYKRLRALPAAEETLRLALRRAVMNSSVDMQVDLLCELAETICDHAEQIGPEEHRSAHAARERARDAVYQAAALADRVADEQWGARALLRVSDVLNRCGDHDDASWLQSRAMGLGSGGMTPG